mmetsp:Transcript_46584/g.83341  ORF Transcript_46584/g.83341 Transcript_46584/m.83341 type:complete len:357 (+) Transcript_46584:2597-3667(+)
MFAMITCSPKLISSASGSSGTNRLAIGFTAFAAASRSRWRSLATPRCSRCSTQRASNRAASSRVRNAFSASFCPMRTPASSCQCPTPIWSWRCAASRSCRICAVRRSQRMCSSGSRNSEREVASRSASNSSRSISVSMHSRPAASSSCICRTSAASCSFRYRFSARRSAPASSFSTAASSASRRAWSARMRSTARQIRHRRWIRAAYTPPRERAASTFSTVHLSSCSSSTDRRHCFSRNAILCSPSDTHRASRDTISASSSSVRPSASTNCRRSSQAVKYTASRAHFSSICSSPRREASPSSRYPRPRICCASSYTSCRPSPCSRISWPRLWDSRTCRSQRSAQSARMRFSSRSFG